MAYTEFKFDPLWIGQETEKAVTTLKEVTGRSDFVVHACEVIKNRLKKDPKSYLAYGPYWWPLKKVLNANGLDIGSLIDEEIAREYKGSSDQETIVMAEKFRDFYYQKFFTENNQFELDPEDENPYILHDPDCETFKYRGSFAHLGLSEKEQREWEQMAEAFGGTYLNR